MTVFRLCSPWAQVGRRSGENECEDVALFCRKMEMVIKGTLNARVEMFVCACV